jgi:hypothetical protein
LSSYETVEQYFNSSDRYHSDEWIDEADYTQACLTNELWSLQWYPDTPIGSYKIYASTFDKLIEFAKQECGSLEGFK